MTISMNLQKVQIPLEIGMALLLRPFLIGLATIGVYIFDASASVSAFFVIKQTVIERSTGFTTKNAYFNTNKKGEKYYEKSLANYRNYSDYCGNDCIDWLFAGF